MSKRISRATKLARGQLPSSRIGKQDVAFIVCHRRKLYGFTFSAGTIII